MDSTRVVVSIPTHDCTQYVRQAVTSVLGQSHHDVEVYVVSDGETEPPWDVLADLDDPRLRRVELSASRGPYFVHDLVLRASDAELLLVQDADDWSEPRRVELLLAELRTRPLAGVTSGQFYDGLYQSYAVTFCAPVRPDHYLDRVRHHGLYRCADLLAVGGYYAGDRFAYDSYLTNVLHLVNALGYVDVALYHRRRRAGSLSRDPSTGSGSPARTALVAELAASWRDLLEAARDGVDVDGLRSIMARTAARRLGEAGARERDDAVAALRAGPGGGGPLRIELTGGGPAG